MGVVELVNEVFPSEFMSDGDMYKLFGDNGFMMGRMISGSKSGYMENHKGNLAIFNANIVTKSRGKVWFGDLDLTLDEEKLKIVAAALKEPLYILREMDARFENEDQDFKFYQAKAVKVIEP
jgi:hypothetical protein